MEPSPAPSPQGHAVALAAVPHFAFLSRSAQLRLRSLSSGAVTAQAPDWQATGDAGRFTFSSGLEFVEGSRDACTLQDGTVLWPVELQAVYSLSPYVSDIFVFGTPQCLQPVAVAAVQPAALQLLLRQHGYRLPGIDREDCIAWPAVPPAVSEELCNHPLVTAEVMNSLCGLAFDHRLAPRQYIDALHVTHVPFAELGLLCPDGRVQQWACRARFRKQLQDLVRRSAAPW